MFIQELPLLVKAYLFTDQENTVLLNTSKITLRFFFIFYSITG
jgi:hypothetical protein